jgi:hypothetical protein
MSSARREAAAAAAGTLLLGLGLGLFLADAPGSFTTAAVLMLAGLVIAGVVLATMSGHPAASPSDAAGWMEFRRELRRARRHDRPLTIVRLPRPIGSEASGDPAEDVRALGLKLRLTDRWWADEESIFVMLPESGRTAATPVLDRLEAVRQGSRTLARVAAFPEDGLTSGAIIAAVLGTGVGPVPTPIRPSVAAEPAAYSTDEELAVSEARR